MSSIAEYWVEGSLSWRIVHSGHDGPHGLEVDGEPPGTLVPIRKEMERKQRGAGETPDVDFLFEIPLLVAREMVGFRHDEDDWLRNSKEYEELVEVKGPGFFSRLFGKGKGP